MNKDKSLQYILKNLKYLHFQQKNQVQSSLLTYPIKDFLKKPPLTNFIPFFPLDCSSSSIEKKEKGNSSKDIVGMGPVETIVVSGPSLPSGEQNQPNVSYYSPYFLNEFRKSGWAKGPRPAPQKGTDWFDSITKQSKFKSSKEDLTKIFTVLVTEPEQRVTKEEDSRAYDTISKDDTAESNLSQDINPVQYTEKLNSFVRGTNLLEKISSGPVVPKEPQEKIPLVKYSKLHELKLVTISIASPEKIKEWAEKTLPNGKVFGEVTNANTLHYKTFKPHKGGLFCERIFGPLKDFECACGIYSKPNELESKKILQHEQIQRTFCPNCDVEYTWSVIRRYQLGYIQLVSPVSHIWYLKANPSYLSLLLDFKRSFLESIIYCTQSITLENLFKKSEKNLFDASPKNLYSVWQKLIEEEKSINGKVVDMEQWRSLWFSAQGLGVAHPDAMIGGFLSEPSIIERSSGPKDPSHPLWGRGRGYQGPNKAKFQKKMEKNKKGQILKTLKIQKRFKIAKLKNLKNFQLGQLGRSFSFKNFLLSDSKKSNQAMLKTKFNYSIYAINNVFIYVIKSLGKVHNPDPGSALQSFGGWAFDIPFHVGEGDGKGRLAQSYTLGPVGPEQKPNTTYSNKTLKTNFWKLSSVKFGASNQVFIQNYNFRAKLHTQSSTTFSFSDNQFLLKNDFNLFYFKKIYSEILQTKEKIRSEILFSNFTDFSKFKELNNKAEVWSKAQQVKPLKQSFAGKTGDLRKNFVEKLFINNSRTKNLKKSLVQNSVLIFFIGFFFSSSSKGTTGPELRYMNSLGRKMTKRNLSSNKNKQFLKTIKNSDRLFTLSGNLMERYFRAGGQEAYASNFSNTGTSNMFQKFLKQVFCLSFLNEKFGFVELTSSHRNQVQNCFYTFFLNSKLTSVFNLKDSLFNLVSFEGMNPELDFNKMNKTLKFFYYISGLKLTKKIQKVSKILNSINLNFFINSKENFNLYNHLKRKKSFKNLKLVYLFFEIFYSPLLNTSSVLQNKTTELSNSEQLVETSFSILLNANSFVRGTNLLKKISSGPVVPSSYKNVTTGPELSYMNSLVPQTLELPEKESKLEFRKKALFLKKQKEIQFQKLSSLLNQKTGLKEFDLFVRGTNLLEKISSGPVVPSSYKNVTTGPELSYMNSLVPRTLELPEKNVPHSFFSKKFIYGIDTRGSGGKVAGNQTSEKIRSFKKNLKNPLYTIPYFYPWPSELEWKSFMYYNSENLSLHDKPIAVYKNGPFQKFSGVTYSELVEEQYEKNNQLTETLTGASLIQKLLTELDSVEFQKMIKQHQILIPIVNRSIRKLSKNLSQTKSDFLKIQKLLQKRDHIIRRFKFLSKISWSGTRLHPSSGSFPSDETRNNPMGTKVPRVQQNTNPIGNSMILTILPVLPPDLRPILKLQNQIAASDLNRLYQRIIYRNERLKKFLKDPSTSQSFEMKYAQRLLQEAVDNLIENGKGSVKPETNARGQALKSLSEILKGKQGRFRQYLLGKRVDYSGRSVIVVGPSLKLSECGLPLRIAIELFLPFLIKKILHYKLAKTVIGAKNFIYNNNSFTWNLLNEIMKNHPILLNRAPTLHRLGIQAFLPKLIHGQAILLHPLVCPAFNADFDGDQMAVHVPITVEARAEAWSFLFSRNHLLSAATGEPIILPSQDMVLGCYYLTSENSNFKLSSTSWSIAGPQRAQQFTTSNSSIQKKSKSNQNFSETYSSNLTKLNKKRKTQPINQLRFHRKCFYNWDSVLNAYQKNQILLQSVIWVRWNGKTEFPNESFSPLEIRVNSFGYYEKIKSKLVLSLKPSVKKPYLNQLICNQYIRTTPGRVLINNVIQNCMRF